VYSNNTKNSASEPTGWVAVHDSKGNEANEQSQPTLLDVGKPHPNAIFKAVIYGDHRRKFGTPEITLRGKRICVTGQISDYQGKPEIVLTDPSG
jgi:hypothetical protein